ncbi:MAG TPA: hypothetical protein VIF83_14505 [Gemmatimonadaceae bacterium]
MRSSALVLAFLICACSAKEKANGTADSAALSQVAPSAAESDPDRSTAGGGVPAGYTGRTDRPNTAITDARYVAADHGWDITTGPAHIVYSANDLASGTYTVSSTIEQLQKPTHPEAFGVFIGGSNLDKPNQAYTYFLVRGSGEVLVKVRDGDSTRDVVKWKAAPDVPKEDASGRATYKLDVQVTADAVKLMVNGKQAASVSKAGLPTDGIAGLRINHNLHVRATPVTITHP